MPNSTNMNLPVPVVSTTPGPQWASALNDCLALVDSHTHVPGSGVAVTPSGLNLEADLSFGSHNAYALRSVRFTAQDAPIGDATDLSCVYVSGVDLYYNDGNGVQIRITEAGGIAGNPGSITGLVSPASASYVAGTETFVWQSDVNTPADMDFASVILRNLTANSKGLTLSAPPAMAADYDLVLPALPASLKMLVLDTSGNITATMDADETSLHMTSTQLSIKDLGVSTAKVVAASVTSAKIASNTITHANMAILRQQGHTVGAPFTSASTSYANTGLSVTITPVGSVVAGTIFNGTLYARYTGGNPASVTFKWVRFVPSGFGGTSTDISQYDLAPTRTNADATPYEVPGSCVSFLDTGASAGQANTYTLWVRCNNAANIGGISSSTVYVYEL